MEFTTFGSPPQHWWGGPWRWKAGGLFSDYGCLEAEMAPHLAYPLVVA